MSMKRRLERLERLQQPAGPRYLIQWADDLVRVIGADSEIMPLAEFQARYPASQPTVFRVIYDDTGEPVEWWDV